MGRRGPAPRPTVVKLREGAREDRINRDEPTPAQRDVSRPEWLTERAVVIWDRLAPDLVDKGVLTAWDVDSFASLCELVVINRDALEHVTEHGTFMAVVDRETANGDTIYRISKNPAWQVARDSTTSLISLGGRFGLNPSDRSQLGVGAREQPKGADRLLS